MFLFYFSPKKAWQVYCLPTFLLQVYIRENLPHGGTQISYNSYIILNKRIYTIQDKECTVDSLGTCTFFLIHAHPTNCPGKRCPKATSSDSKVLADSSGL